MQYQYRCQVMKCYKVGSLKSKWSTHLYFIQIFIWTDVEYERSSMSTANIFTWKIIIKKDQLWLCPFDTSSNILDLQLEIKAVTVACWEGQWNGRNMAFLRCIAVNHAIRWWFRTSLHVFCLLICVWWKGKPFANRFVTVCLFGLVCVLTFLMAGFCIRDFTV